jgi:branched-chain amino acid transport system permease protein
MSDLLLQAAASGIVTGCVYALVALSLVIVYKSTDVVNFAGGELLMLGGYTGLLALIYFELSYPLMFVAVIVAMYVVGAAFERITLSTITGRRYSKKAEADLVPMVVATIGLGYLLKGVCRHSWPVRRSSSATSSCSSRILRSSR